MEPKDLITLIGIIVSLIVGFSGLYISFQNSKKTIFINSVTASRAKWIETIRNNIAEFCGIATQIFYGNSEEKMKKMDKLQQLKFLIKLQLNRNDTYDQLIIKTIDSIAKHAYHVPSNKTIEEIEKLINLTQDLLKLEWEGVKEESKKGNLSKTEKRKLYNKHLRSKQNGE